MSASPGQVARDLDRERPAGESAWPFLWRGVTTQSWAVLIGLLFAWGGGVWVIVLAVVGAIAGGITGLAVGLGANAAPSIAGLSGSELPLLNAAGPSIQSLGPIAGVVIGALALPAAFYGLTAGASFVDNPASFLVNFAAGLFPGIIIAAAILWGWYRFEGWILRVSRGIRPMSEREQATLSPIIEEVAGHMNISTHRPSFVIVDDELPHAFAGLRHVGITSGMLEESETDELAAIIAHELYHWQKGHAAGDVAIKAVSWPVIIFLNALILALRLAPPLIGAIVSLLTWQFALVGRYVIAPVAGSTARKQEYEADTAAVEAGYGAALVSFLERVGHLEPDHSGWEKSMLAQHPPPELRIDAISKTLRNSAGDRDRGSRSEQTEELR